MHCVWNARAARRCPQDDCVLGWRAVDCQLEVNLTVHVGDCELADGVRAETGALGREDNLLQADRGEVAVEHREELAAGQGPRLAEPGPAVDLSATGVPDGALLVGEPAPAGGYVAQP